MGTPTQINTILRDTRELRGGAAAIHRTVESIGHRAHPRLAWAVDSISAALMTDQRRGVRILGDRDAGVTRAAARVAHPIALEAELERVGAQGLERGAGRRHGAGSAVAVEPRAALPVDARAADQLIVALAALADPLFTDVARLAGALRVAGAPRVARATLEY